MTKRTAAPWLFWLAAVRLFGYGHLTRVAPGGMVDALMRDFAVGAAMLSNISAMYWYAYSIFQIPGGFLLDRFGPARIIALSSLLCTLGGLLFAFAPSVEAANAGRFITGAGGAALYACCIKIAHTSFNSQRFALLGGITILIGMFGASLGQAPVATLIEIDGWRPVMFWIALAALPLGTLVFLGHRKRSVAATAVISSRELLGLMRDVARLQQYWIITLFAMMIAGPAVSFPVWGIAYYMQVLGYARPEAAIFTPLALLGWAVGSLSAGWLSGRLPNRHKLIAIGQSVTGLSAGGIVVSFILISNNCPPRAVGTATGISNTLVMLMSAAILLIMGFVLDLLWTGEIAEGIRIYSPFAFGMAYLIMPASSFVALLAALAVRETTDNKQLLITET